MNAKYHFLIISLILGLPVSTQGAPAADSVNHAAGLISLGSSTQAKEELEHILQRHPKNKDARLLMGLALANIGAGAAGHGEVALAIEHLRKSLDFNPSDAYVHRDLAKALYAQGGKEKATRECKEAARLSPDDSGLAGGCGLGVDSDKSAPELLGLAPAVSSGSPKGTDLGVLVAPKAIDHPLPPLSEKAHDLGFEVTTSLWITVSSQGVVTEAAIIREAGLGLDQNALRAVRKWTFQPATLEGRQTTTRVQIKTAFHFLKPGWGSQTEYLPRNDQGDMPH